MASQVLMKVDQSWQMKLWQVHAQMLLIHPLLPAAKYTKIVWAYRSDLAHDISKFPPAYLVLGQWHAVKKDKCECFYDKL